MAAWARLARDLDPTRLDSMLHDAPLADAIGIAPASWPVTSGADGHYRCLNSERRHSRRGTPPFRT
ncbi:hypothetical protein RAA17_04040 [Komagataeibacter rhaeticus]|nr:hypothetical protein [Komagataeibacter rhaeticus]